jgi:hypothetical protein
LEYTANESRNAAPAMMEVANAGGAAIATGTTAMTPTAVPIAFSRKDVEVEQENRFGNPIGLGPSQRHTDRRGGTQRNPEHDRDEDRGLYGDTLAFDDLGSFETTRKHDPVERPDPNDDAVFGRDFPR